MKHTLSGDRPVTHPDDDKLGFGPFAEALATALLEMDPRDGLVISVEAPWGAGKSSAVALAERALKVKVLTKLGCSDAAGLSRDELNAAWEKRSEKTTHVVRFNPWIFSGQENLTRAFFQEISNQIGADNGSKLASAASVIADMLPSVMSGMGSIAAVSVGEPFGVLQKAGEAVGNIAAKKLRPDKYLENARTEFSEALRERRSRIIVIIDDIDRLLLEEMRTVFSLVKSLGDLPNIVYVICFDRSAVESALGWGAGQGEHRFLDKIVQVSLRLPPPGRFILHQLCRERVQQIVGDDKGVDWDRWQSMFHSSIAPYIEWPRDIARLTNSLKVQWPNVKRDVDLADLVLLTTLQLFDPKVYDVLAEEVAYIVFDDYRRTMLEYSNNIEIDYSFRKLDEVISKIEQPDRARHSLSCMFPNIARHWGRDDFSVVNNDEIKTFRRICEREHYRNYFLFGPDPRFLSRADIEAILSSENPSGFSELLASLPAEESNGRGRSVADTLEQISRVLREEKALKETHVRILIDHSDALLRSSRADIRAALLRFITTCSDEIDESEKERILNVLGHHASGVLLRALVLEEMAAGHGLFGEAQRPEAERFLTADKVREAAAAVREQIPGACSDGAVWSLPHPDDLIWCCARIGGTQQMRDWLKTVIADDQLVVRLAPHLLTPVTATDGRYDVFDRDMWQTLLDVDELFRRLEYLAATDAEARHELDQLRASEARRRH